MTKEKQLSIEGIINSLGATLGGFTIDNEKFESLGKSNELKEEFDATIIHAFDSDYRGYFDKNGNIKSFNVDDQNTWAYYYSDPINLESTDKYINFTSFEKGIVQRSLIIYDRNKKPLAVPENIGKYKTNRIEIPEGATTFIVSKKCEDPYYNEPFVCSIYKDEEIANINLNGSDGSGYFASKKIIWDVLGNISYHGKFASNYAGNRIIIDPNTRSLKFIDKKDNEILKMWFVEQSNGWVVPYMELKTLTSTGKVHSRTSVSGTGVSVASEYEIYSIGPSGIIAKSTNLSGNDPLSLNYNSSSDSLYVKMRLPSSADGLQKGELYQSGGTVKIKT